SLVPTATGPPEMVCQVHVSSGGSAARHAGGVCLPPGSTTYSSGSRVARISRKSCAATVSIALPEPDMSQNLGRLALVSVASVEGSFCVMAGEPAPKTLFMTARSEYAERSH